MCALGVGGAPRLCNSAIIYVCAYVHTVHSKVTRMRHGRQALGCNVCAQRTVLKGLQTVGGVHLCLPVSPGLTLRDTA